MRIQIRDAVHNFIDVGQKEGELIGTRAFQRLRGIRQLALANLVYPGALHTRFDHSLGVMHVAGKLAKALQLNSDDTQLIRYAALLHDIGHGPFSHVSENALDRYADRTTLADDQKLDKIHERVTALIIQNDAELGKRLAHTDRENITSLLGIGYGDPILRALVSGPLDADKQDYLLRDSYFCGVQYGVFDIDQLHRSLIVRPDKKGRSGDLMLKPDGIHAAEQYVLAKYYLTANVYRHKVRLITDQMIIRAIVLGIERDGIETLRKLYTFDNTPAFIHNYSCWDDYRCLCTFGLTDEYEGTKCHELFSRLLNRRLFKRVFQERPENFSPSARTILQKLSKMEMQSIKSEVEHDIAQEIYNICGVRMDEDYVIMHVFNIKSVKEMSRNDESGVLMATDPEPVPFEQESTLFASIQNEYKEEFVEIYAPMEWSTRADRDKLCGKLRDPLRAIIEQYGADDRLESKS